MEGKRWHSQDANDMLAEVPFLQAAIKKIVKNNPIRLF
jgi:hypothetical protein